MKKEQKKRIEEALKLLDAFPEKVWLEKSPYDSNLPKRKNKVILTTG